MAKSVGNGLLCCSSPIFGMLFSADNCWSVRKAPSARPRPPGEMQIAHGLL